MCFGDYEGRRTDDVMSENPEWNIDLIMHGDTSLCAPNGENLGSVRARVAETMNRIIEENRGKSILIVTHGITLKALMYYFKDKEVNNEVMGQATLTKINVDINNNFNIEFKNDNVEQTVKDLVLKSKMTIKTDDFESTYNTTIKLKDGDVLVFEEKDRGYVKPVEEMYSVEEAIKELELIK